MKEVGITGQFRKDLKRFRHRSTLLEKVYQVSSLLKDGKTIPRKYRPHKLTGRWEGYMECHVESDLLLIWYETLTDGTEIVYLVRLGSRS